MFLSNYNQRIFHLNQPRSGLFQIEGVGQLIRDNIEVIGHLMFQETSYYDIQIQEIGFWINS